MYKLTCLEVCGKYYGLIQSCLSNRFQRVALNKESSNWCHIKAGIPQGSILGPLFFQYMFQYSSGSKLFADNTFCCKTTPLSLNKDLLKISQWTYQLKVLFNPDTSKQAQKIVFSREKRNYLELMELLSLTIYQQSRGLYNEKNRSASGYKIINEKVKKAKKGSSIIKKLNLSLPRSSLITIYKPFVRPHLDYGDINYDQPSNASLSDKLRRLYYLYKVVSTKMSPFLYEITLPLQRSQRNPGCFKPLTLSCML